MFKVVKGLVVEARLHGHLLPSIGTIFSGKGKVTFLGSQKHATVTVRPGPVSVSLPEKVN